VLDDADLRAELGRRAKAFHGSFLEPGAYVERLMCVWRAAAEGRTDVLEAMNVGRYFSSADRAQAKSKT
jgi:hypothetical protein